MIVELSCVCLIQNVGIHEEKSKKGMNLSASFEFTRNEIVVAVKSKMEASINLIERNEQTK